MGPIDPNSIARSVRAATERGLPPVESWSPPHTGDIDIRIGRDGSWHHEGHPISRPELVRLFSTILRREGDRFFLVTPVEKVGIIVEDAPFIAVDFDVEGTGADQTLRFLTNVGDRVTADRDHAIRVDRDPGTGEPAPYLHVRAGLEARIDRKSFYRLADLGEVKKLDETAWFGIWSGGRFHPMAREVDITG